MRVTSFLASAFFIGAGFVLAESDVLVLSSDNFDSVVSKEDLMLVEFYAPWCGHCKALAPAYEEAATSLKEKKIPLAKVDCVDQADLCGQYGVQGYPTLKVFRKGDPTEYSGPRKADGIVTYMVKQSLPAVSQLTAAAHEEFKNAEKVVVVAYLASSTEAPAPAFSAAAEKHRDDYLFGLTTDEAAIKAAGVTPPAIVVYQQFDDGRVDFPSQGIQDTSLDVLEKFLADNSVPLLDEITGDNYPIYAANGHPIAYLFISPDDEKKQTYIDAIKPVAKKNKGALNFVWIDAVRYLDHAKSLTLKGDKFPAFVIQTSEGHKYPISDADPTYAVVDDFVTRYVAGKVEPTLRSEPIPEKNDDPVVVVVNKQYEQIVLDDSRDVFIEFYAPWCGHCKRLAPIWDEVGEDFIQQHEKITIAKMDYTQNDLPIDAPFEIKGFPTLKFKPAGSKEFIDYEGDRTYESLVAFAVEHSKNGVTTPVKAAASETVVESSATPASSTVVPEETHAQQHIEFFIYCLKTDERLELVYSGVGSNGVRRFNSEAIVRFVRTPVTTNSNTWVIDLCSATTMEHSREESIATEQEL
ncbi:protein disulfide-isomerase precursor, partial [Tulasnella sp. 403]